MVRFHWAILLIYLIDGLIQKKRNSLVSALEMSLFWIKLSKCAQDMIGNIDNTLSSETSSIIPYLQNKPNIE